MTNPNVVVMTCDDLRIEFNGKLILVGIYPGNITIPANTVELAVNQLQFLFFADFPKEEVPKEITFEVELPGEPAQRQSITVAVEPPPPIQEKHTRWLVRQGLGFVRPVLRLGKIQARMITDGVTYPAVAPWIEQVELPPNLTTGTNASPQPSGQSPIAEQPSEPSP
jgi:hypothetical protein